jgi:radical SAM protein with 4Fe4S-binding SPASM domain
MELHETLVNAYRASGKLLEAHCDLLYPCDLDCEHCYLDEKARPQRSTAFWKDVFDQLAEQQVLLLHLSGGEIFLRKDLFELIEHARSLGLMVCLKTHGGHVTQKKAERLAALGVSIVYVSYYSHRPEVHDAVTREPGSHGRTLQGLRLLAAAGLRVKVNLMVMQRNVDDVSEVLKQCEELGINVGLSTEIHSALSGADDPLEVALSIEKRTAFRELLDTRTSSCGVSGPTDDWGEKRFCGAATTGIYIDPEGKVMPCSFWPDVLGEIDDTVSLATVLESSKKLEVMRAFKNADRHSCGDCGGKETCHFCPGQSWHETRDPMAPAAAICADTYSQLVAKARQAGESDPPKPPGLRSSPFRVLNAAQTACGS